MPESTASQTQLENIDCLICHQAQYKRVKSGGVFVPDTANMTITMDQAVQTVTQAGQGKLPSMPCKGWWW